MHVKNNIIFLAIVQGVNYIFPLITFPYVARILGVENFGKIALAQAIILYMTFVIDFGFNLTATKNISLAAEIKNQGVINKIYTETLISKFFLLIISCLILFILILTFPQLQEIKWLLVIGIFSLVGTTLFPLWLFQGIQKMHSIVIVTTIAKFLSTIMVFITVNDRNDINWAVFSQFLGVFISGFLGFYLVKKNNYAELICLEKPIASIKKSLNTGFPIFLTFIFSSLYTSLNLFICSFVIPVKDIGYFASAEKINQVSKSLISPIQQSVYPHIASQSGSIIKFKNEIKKYGSFLILFTLLLSCLLFTFSEYIVLLVLGSDFLVVGDILKILSPTPVIASFAIIFGQWGLVNLNKQFTLSKIYMCVGLLHLSYVFVFLNFWGIYGAAYSILLTESLVSLVIFIVFLRVLNNVE